MIMMVILMVTGANRVRLLLPPMADVQSCEHWTSVRPNMSAMFYSLL